MVFLLLPPFLSLNVLLPISLITCSAFSFPAHTHTHTHTHASWQAHTFSQLFHILKLPTCSSLPKKEESAQIHLLPHFPLIPNHTATYIILLPLFHICSSNHLKFPKPTIFPQLLTTSPVFSF